MVDNSGRVSLAEPVIIKIHSPVSMIRQLDNSNKNNIGLFSILKPTTLNLANNINNLLIIIMFHISHIVENT